MSEYTLVDVLQNPVLVEKINFTSLSAAILTSLITGAGDCKPENFMVKFVREKSPYGSAGEVEKVEILGVSADPVFQKTAFQYERIEGAYSNVRPPNVQDLLAQREQGVKEVGLGFNVLFFLPQMDEPVDPEVCRFFRSSPTVPEEMVCSWLRYLHQQNKRNEGLRASGGFTAEDFKALQLPIKIPLGKLRTPSLHYTSLHHFVARLLHCGARIVCVLPFVARSRTPADTTFLPMSLSTHLITATAQALRSACCSGCRSCAST